MEENEFCLFIKVIKSESRSLSLGSRLFPYFVCLENSYSVVLAILASVNFWEGGQGWSIFSWTSLGYYFMFSHLW